MAGPPRAHVHPRTSLFSLERAGDIYFQSTLRYFSPLKSDHPGCFKGTMLIGDNTTVLQVNSTMLIGDNTVKKKAL